MENSNDFTKFVRSKVFVYFSHNTAILYFESFLYLYGALLRFLQHFHATSSFSDLNLHCFSAKSETCENSDKNFHKVDKLEFF